MDIALDSFCHERGKIERFEIFSDFREISDWDMVNFSLKLPM